MISHIEKFDPAPFVTVVDSDLSYGAAGAMSRSATDMCAFEMGNIPVLFCWAPLTAMAAEEEAVKKSAIIASMGLKEKQLTGLEEWDVADEPDFLLTLCIYTSQLLPIECHV
jgi:hypothetical protein